MSRVILVTGAAGNVGAKVSAHLRSLGYELRLLDRAGGDGIIAADFGDYDDAWVKHFAGVDTVLHFAGNPNGHAPWASALRDNVGGTQHVLRAARDAKIRRVIFASTNQVMLGYRFGTGLVTTDMPPAPLSPYGISKLMGEELGRGFAEATGADFLALRIGYFQRGENLPGAHMLIGEWGQSMWLSNRDMNQAAERAIEAPPFGFAAINLVSANQGMRWDLEHAREIIGYVPLDHAVPVITDAHREMDRIARDKRIVPGQWLNESFDLVEP
ncbi:MAG: NAD(P)-dependent oxidoreductase [Hyphomicrobiales bacterium]|nr:MAG: NAD(P)-dependent oxidoreductase [Hyphomicrobiales bacterium]